MENLPFEIRFEILKIARQQAWKDKIARFESVFKESISKWKRIEGITDTGFDLVCLSTSTASCHITFEAYDIHITYIYHQDCNGNCDDEYNFLLNKYTNCTKYYMTWEHQRGNQWTEPTVLLTTIKNRVENVVEFIDYILESFGEYDPEKSRQMFYIMVRVKQDSGENSMDLKRLNRLFDLIGRGKLVLSLPE